MDDDRSSWSSVTGMRRMLRRALVSFFIVTARAQMLDDKYTAFGRVVSGLDVVQKIEASPVNGETPIERVELLRVRIEKR